MKRGFIYALLFGGCLHSRLTFPLTHQPGRRISRAQRLTGTYVVCLDCGKEFAYDWQQMRVIHQRETSREFMSVAEEEGA